MAKLIRQILDGSAERHVMAERQCLIAGIDEAGRGPLAGPVVAAAVILDLDDVPPGLADSKLLSPATRAALYDVILMKARAVSIAMASAQEIDAINIREATHLAMRRCAAGLSLRPGRILVDGHEKAGLDLMAQGWIAEAIIKGDGRFASIAAASIIAKVTRDRLMARLDCLYPQYGFAKHHGYGTGQHSEAIHHCGPSPHHRFSFAPVKGCWQRCNIPLQVD